MSSIMVFKDLNFVYPGMFSNRKIVNVYQFTYQN